MRTPTGHPRIWITDSETARCRVTLQCGTSAVFVVDVADHKNISAHTPKYNKHHHRIVLSPKDWGKRHPPRHQIARVVIGITDPAVVVDHIDGDTMNNRRSNLRIATVKENAQNRVGAYEGKTNGLPRGVGIANRGPRRYFRVEHKIDGRNVHGGYFKTVEAADEAAKAWRREHMPFATDC